MALSGLQIQKLLPGTNCKECGSSTCMAFAMKLAAKKAMLSECPHASDEAKQTLGAASEPPVKGVKIGADVVSPIGEEIVMYRHEKTFVNKPVIAVNLDEGADLSLAEKIRAYRPVRVGEELFVGAIAITQKSDSEAGAFSEYCAKVYEKTKLPLIIRAKDLTSLDKASAAVTGSHSILCAVSEDIADKEAVKIAQRDNQVLAITAPDVDGIFGLTTMIKAGGFNDLVIEFQTHSLCETFQTNSIARKAALKNNIKALGYAFLRFINTGNAMDDTIAAVTEINKFGGIIVMPSFDPAQLITLLALRQNIYTDPQKPIQVEPKLYAIGEPDKKSPVFVTTNFSLTYFLVSGEIENAGISAWLIIPECEGFSVLTAWAAGKFSGASIGKFIKEIELEKQVDTRSIVIPGYVAQISGELEENLPGFKVLVGPSEAADLEGFIKNVLKK
ncbi:MAG: acetyl-CoA decarbonylase/synthase complex subunit gamma [Treponema sp.]|jgi:acetyl-CoA decarbonylase/synthase complex subunit gamma|nr:acetyl-CoA decarbonylase/synthase complex subunit gamma [Treponema sp.]